MALQIKKRVQKHQFYALLTTVSIIFIGGSICPKTALAEKTVRLVAQGSATLPAESAQSETLYLNNDRTYSYNLIAREKGTIGNVTVPAGATIVGKYIPVEGGLKYVAEAVTYDNYSYTIDASSSIIKDEKDPRDTSGGAVAEDAGIGAAGGAVLGEVLGDAGATEIVGGAAAGAAAGNLTADRVVVIEPDTKILLSEQ